ncbi:hypothetical protein I302_108525 [Kwoniella bestiolae CBS 10118]
MTPTRLFDGIGFYFSPVQGEDILSSDIGRMIMPNEGIIYPIPSLDQVTIILIPMSLPYISDGMIPLDPDFTWEDPDTLDAKREWTPELLVRYFEDTVREGVRSEGRKVVLGHGWVKSCLRSGRMLGKGDDWGGWRIIGSYDLFDTFSQLTNQSDHLSQAGTQSYPITLAQPVQPYLINHASTSNLFTSNPPAHSMPHSISATPHQLLSHSVLGHGTIHKNSEGTPLSTRGGTACRPQQPRTIRSNTDYQRLPPRHAVRTPPPPRPRFPGWQPSDTGSLRSIDTGNHQPHQSYSLFFKRAQNLSRTPVSIATANNASTSAQISTPSHASPGHHQPQSSRFHPYCPSILQNGDQQGQPQLVSPRDRAEQSMESPRSAPAPPQKMAITKAWSIVPSERSHPTYIPPSPISPAPPHGQGKYPDISNGPRSNGLRIVSPSPTILTSLSQPLWWDMGTSRTIGVPSGAKETRNESTVVGKTPITPLFEAKSGAVAETPVKPLFIDTSGSPLKIFVESNVHPRYEREVRVCLIHLIYGKTVRRAAENGAIWRHSRTGGIAVTLQWLEDCLEKGELVNTARYRVRVVDYAKDLSAERPEWGERAVDVVGTLSAKQVVKSSQSSSISHITLSDPSKSPETSKPVDTTASSLPIISNTSFPTCPPMSAYDPLAWQVEKIAQKIYEKGEIEGLRSVTTRGGDQAIDDHWIRLCDSATHGPLVKARVRQLQDQVTKTAPPIHQDELLITTFTSKEDSILTPSITSGRKKDKSADLDSNELGLTS